MTNAFRRLTLGELTIDDERSFRHVGLYAVLKDLLVRDGYRFRVPPADAVRPWDEALLLNLTFWSSAEHGDVLTSDHLPADTVAHVAWHHAAVRALPAAAPGARTSVDAMFFAEAIASAFDLYLVGRLLGHAPDAEFLQTQVPAMGDAAADAGVDEAAFEASLGEIAAAPERAFEDLRALLVDAAGALVRCDGLDAAADALAALRGRRFAELLHHYALSNWVLYARAYGDLAPDPRVRALDAELRAAGAGALDLLATRWLGDA
jgi:hypothetical protein